MRFPGGNWGDENNLRPWHLDMFVALCRELGAEPQVSVRLRGGTPEQAAALVRYANQEQGYNIRYWSIGNEPELYHAKPGFEGYDTERFNREWRAIAQAMRAVDPDIRLLGPEVTQFTGDPATDPKDEKGRDWVRSFLAANGDLVDVVSIHRYPFPQGMTGREVTPEALLANPAEWDQILPRLREAIRELTGRDLPVAVTEINSYWTGASGGQTTPDSFLSALWWADVLGHLIEQDATIVAYFSLQSSPTIGSYGLFARREARPSFNVYRLYREFGSRRLSVDNPAAGISAYAAQRDDGAVSLLLINRTAEPVEQTVQLAGARTGPEARVWRFDADHPTTEMPPLPWDPARTTVALPSYSATLFLIPLETTP